jgi:exosome complex component RRP41
MKDLVSSCAAGKYEGNLILDLGDYEDKNGEADVPVAYLPKIDQVTLLQMEGIMTQEETEKCIELAIEGCKQIYEIQKEALKKKYGMVEGAEEKEEAPAEEPEEASDEEEPAEEAEEE